MFRFLKTSRKPRENLKELSVQIECSRFDNPMFQVRKSKIPGPEIDIASPEFELFRSEFRKKLLREPCSKPRELKVSESIQIDWIPGIGPKSSKTTWIRGFKGWKAASTPKPPWGVFLHTLVSPLCVGGQHGETHAILDSAASAGTNEKLAISDAHEAQAWEEAKSTHLTKGR